MGAEIDVYEDILHNSWKLSIFSISSHWLIKRDRVVMGIIVKLDVMLARRRMSLTELAERVGVTVVNLSNLKRGCCRAIRFSTLEAICHELHCQPGDILEFEE